MRQTLSAIALATLAFGASSGALSQTGETTPADAPEGPLRLLSVSDDTLVMAQGEPATSLPDQPRDIWIWTLIRNALRTDNALTFDTIATRFRVDCAAGTTEPTGQRTYLFGQLKRGTDKAETKESPLAPLAIRAACEAGYQADAPRYDDPKAARAAAAKLFAAHADTHSGAPFRIVRAFDDMILMIEGEVRNSRPEKPVALSFWSFNAKTDMGEGLSRADASASRYQIDCQASTLQQTGIRLYLNGQIVMMADTTGAMSPAKSTIEKLLIERACDPNFKAETLADRTAAQSYAAAHFRKAGALEGSPGPSEALRVDSPLRFLVQERGVKAVMMAGDPPTVRSDEPVERWLWSFLKNEATAGDDRYDTEAVLTRFDCAAATSQDVKRELFLKGRFVKSAPLSRPADQLGAQHRYLRAACDPDFHNNAKFFVDSAAARLTATKAFAKASAAKPAPAKPEAAASPPAAAAEARQGRTRLPIRLTDPDPSIPGFAVNMNEGPAPKTRPTRPVEIWDWTFFPNPTIVGGKVLFDSIATLRRVDCDKETALDLIRETYAKGELMRVRDFSKNAPGTDAPREKPATKRLLASACDPAYKPDAETFADHRAARAAVDAIVAAQKRTKAGEKQTDAPPQPSAESKTTSPGEAERIGGPIWTLSQDSTRQIFFMAASPKPAAPPVKPVEIWIWHFSKQPQQVIDKRSYDTWAIRMRIDCKGQTVRHQLVEGYTKDGQFDNSWELSSKAQKPKRGTLNDRTWSYVCDPAFRIGGQRFANHNIARAAAMRTPLGTRRK